MGFGSVFTPYFIADAFLDYPHIAGVVGKWDILGRIYIFICLFIGLYHLIREYFKSGGIRRKKIKYYVFGTSLYAFSGLIFTSVIPYFTGKSAYYDFAAYFSLAWMILTIYAIIRYRFLEIETVIHKTVLWILTILLLIFPVSTLSYVVLEKTMHFFPAFLNVVLLSTIFLAFYYYYSTLRPQIDHVFRRRKYDYLKILGEISQEIGGIIDLDELSKKTVLSIKESIYPQTIHLLLRDEEEKRFYLKGSIIDSTYSSFDRKSSPFFINELMDTINILKDTRHPIEKELLGVDPAYKDIKDEAEELLRKTDSVLLFGLFLEDDLIGLLFLGKRESLQEYTRLDINSLQNLSLSIANQFYTSLHHYDIVEKQRLQHELTLAKNVQESLLPQKPPEIPGLSLFGMYAPSREVGGDYYDFIEVTSEKEQLLEEGYQSSDYESADIGQKRLYVAVGDVSGKGLDAGLVMVILKSSLYNLTKSVKYPMGILNELNKFLYAEIRQQKFVSLLLFSYSLQDPGVIKYSSAGHEHILIHRAQKVPGEETEAIKSGGVILGMMENLEPYLEEKSINLQQGDKILLYTDGATEARSPDGDFYGLERLIKSFQSHANSPIKEAVHKVYEDIKAFMSDAEQYDDITLVGLEKD